MEDKITPALRPAEITHESPSVETNFNAEISSSDLLSEQGQVPGNKFAFTPWQLSLLVENRNPASVTAFGGLDGLLMGLRTDGKRGLSAEEDILDGHVTLEDVFSHAHHNESKELPSSEKLDNALSTIGKFTDRRYIFGENRVPRRKPKTFLKLLWLAYNDKLMFLLTVSATISLALGLYQNFTSTEAGPGIEWVEGVAIVIAVIVIVFATAINDYQKNYKFYKLNKKKDERMVTASRSGHHQPISIFDVLVGDILHIEAGDIVPADGILLEGFDVQCDESSLTGESDLVRKTLNIKGDPFILSGTRVEVGVGSYLILSVGVNSAYGKIVMSLQDDNQETPLQQKLGSIAKKIIRFGLVAGVIAFIVLLIRYLVDIKNIQGGASVKSNGFLQVLILSITVVVIAVPEGLPLTVTLALAFATTRMMKDKNLVRILRSCETMGGATTICSDKTGTLTQNRMSVVSGIIGISSKFSDEHLTHTTQAVIPDQGPLPNTTDIVESLSTNMKELIKSSFVLNSTAIDTNHPNEFMGSSTEKSLLKFSRDYLGMGSVSEERSNGNVVEMIPFSSDRKWMAIIVKLQSGGYRMYVKGAAEIVLDSCSQIIEDLGHEVSFTQLTPDMRSSLNKTMIEYSDKSLRVIVIAYRDVQEWDPSNIELASLSDLVFVGAFGIRDPLRPGVKESVRLCQSAGVFVRMVTGDSFSTATAIAEECGIYTSGGIAMDGPTFRSLTSHQLDLVLPRLQVLARSSPDDKMKLVTQLKSLNEVVAVTGDGTNDALALKAADVGFSMGLSGTEVAKEASAIVLMDDNFASIVKAIGWGRAVHEAVKKFIQFQFTINFSAGILTVISAFVGGTNASIFTVVQLLWINLIMDTFAALALATDFPTPGLLLQRPEPRTSSVLNTTIWKMIVGQSVYQMTVIFTLHYAGAGIFNYHTELQLNQLQTMTFNIYVWMQFFNQTKSVLK
ncbi:calcium-translocating P-type ATPase [Dendryphion nanum]|uniref:Calcium-transporting ATPase 2 n=1 Tax=Dendryphion nanum TaxID=256645 RepID=A0A9P9DP25_9PLEO|nr:calcium-translocating P-type ATPase [Dendryphion nanum]